jgi:hypothetical protein
MVSGRGLVGNFFEIEKQVRGTEFVLKANGDIVSKLCQYGLYRETKFFS